VKKEQRGYPYAVVVVAAEGVAVPEDAEVIVPEEVEVVVVFEPATTITVPCMNGW